MNNNEGAIDYQDTYKRMRSKRPKRTALTESQRTILVNGLHVAAEFYKRDAAKLRDGDYRPIGGIKTSESQFLNARAVIDRMSAQFDRQAQEATALAELLENAEAIEVTA